MSIARIRSHGQETWYYNVVSASHDEHGYLTLELDGYPYRVHFWRAPSMSPPPFYHNCSVLLAETGPDVTALLREESGWTDEPRS